MSINLSCASTIQDPDPSFLIACLCGHLERRRICKAPHLYLKALQMRLSQASSLRWEHVWPNKKLPLSLCAGTAHSSISPALLEQNKDTTGQFWASSSSDFARRLNAWQGLPMFTYLLFTKPLPLLWISPKQLSCQAQEMFHGTWRCSCWSAGPVRR